MNTVKILVTLLVVSILGVLTWALFLPTSVHIEQKVVIDAPMEKVFSQVNNFHNWQNWSPWKDSTLSTVYEGSREGVGAKMIWTDPKEGKSIQTIIESTDNKMVVTELIFNKQDSDARNYFYFAQKSDSVEVSWVMDVEDLSFPFGRFVGYMIKKGASFNFKKGLESIKNYCESNTDIPDFGGYEIIDEVLAEKYFLSYEGSGTMAELGTKIGNAFGEIMINMGSLQITPSGKPHVEWNEFDPESVSSFRCMMPIAVNQDLEGEVSSYTVPEGRFIWLKYVGAYDKSAIAWESLDKYVEYNNLEMNGSPFEEYVTDPGMEADTNKWITNIYFPVKEKE